MLEDFSGKLNTDKFLHTHGYTEIYEMLFSPLKDKPIKILEIGVYGGASIKLWEQYFTQARIYGADINNQRTTWSDRVEIFHVDQSREDSLINMMNEIGNVDIIIDDGSHISEHQILGFKTLFKYINPEGYYIIEDITCAYSDRFNEGKFKVTDYIKTLIDPINVNGKSFKGNKRLLRNEIALEGLEASLLWMLVSNGLCVLKKY